MDFSSTSWSPIPLLLSPCRRSNFFLRADLVARPKLLCLIDIAWVDSDTTNSPQSTKNHSPTSSSTLHRTGSAITDSGFLSQSSLNGGSQIGGRPIGGGPRMLYPACYSSTIQNKQISLIRDCYEPPQCATEILVSFYQRYLDFTINAA